MQNKVEEPNNWKEKEHLKTKFRFWVFGVVLYGVTWSIVIAAAEDILSATSLPTSSVLLVQAGTNAVITMLMPFVYNRCSYKLKVVVVCIAIIAGTLTISLPKVVWWKLFGVLLTTIGIGVGESSFASLTAYYRPDTISAYASGTGFGFFLGPLFYTGMTVVGCVTPDTTLLTSLVLTPIIPLCYFTLDKGEPRQGDTTTTGHKGVNYSPISAASEEEEDLPLTSSDKIYVVWKSLPHVISLFIGMFCEYLTLQAVVSTLAFSNSPFGPRDHYVIYSMFMALGELIGRSYVAILLCIKPDISPYTPHTWIYSAIQALIMLFLIFASWYRFLTSVWIVMFSMFMVGTVIGMQYINVYTMVGDGECSNQKIELSRSIVAGYAMGCGGLTAALVGLYLEPYLQHHCLHVTTMTGYCLTRSVEGWNKTISCL